MSRPEGYYIEHNGDCWQSVFPAAEAEKSQLHPDPMDAFNYMHIECGVPADAIHEVQRAKCSPTDFVGLPFPKVTR